VENESRELVNNVEQTIHDPVGKPLRGFRIIIRFKSKEAHKGGIGNSQKTGDVAGADAEHHTDHTEYEAIPGKLFP